MTCNGNVIVEEYEGDRVWGDIFCNWYWKMVKKIVWDGAGKVEFVLLT